MDGSRTIRLENLPLFEGTKDVPAEKPWIPLLEDLDEPLAESHLPGVIGLIQKQNPLRFVRGAFDKPLFMGQNPGQVPEGDPLPFFALA